LGKPGLAARPAPATYLNFTFVQVNTMKPITICAVLILALGVAAALVPARAYSQAPDLLEVDQLILFASVPQGGSRTLQLSVGSGPGADVGVEVRGLGQAPDGRFIALDAAADASPYSAREYLSVSPSAFRLEPGQRRQVEVSVNLPGDAGPGGRYAVLYVYTRPPEGEESVGVSAAIAVSVVLTIEGSELVREGEVTGIDASETHPLQPMVVTATFANRGNYHFRVSGRATLLNQQGVQVSQGTMPRTEASVVPAFAQNLRASLEPNGHWEPGSYLLQVEVFTDDGLLVASGTREVEIGADGFAIGGGGEPGGMMGMVSDRTGLGMAGLDMVLLAVTSIAVLGMLVSLGTLVYVVRQKRA
jgi:hypothetical protein